MLCLLLYDALDVQALDSHMLADRIKLLLMRSLSQRPHAQVNFCDELTAIRLWLHAEDHAWQEKPHEPEGGRELDVLIRDDPREDDPLLKKLSRNVFLEVEDVSFFHASARVPAKEVMIRVPAGIVALHLFEEAEDCFWVRLDLNRILQNHSNLPSRVCVNSSWSS